MGFQHHPARVRSRIERARDSHSLRDGRAELEHVGGRILKALRAELPLTEAIDRIEVEITKFAPPIGGDCDRITVVLQG